MTRRFIILGAGAAGAAAALALTRDPGTEVTVLDVGGRLPAAHDAARERLSEQTPEQWSWPDRDLISAQPTAGSESGVLPEKRSYGSDFPFRDFGQRRGLTGDGVVNEAVVSGAYGGFTNVWGAQVMPFSPSSFRDWPFSFDDLRPHYAAILDEVSFVGQDDDLASLFPLIASARDLPQLSERSNAVLERYRRHRSRVNGHGVTLGRARLAMRADACIRCGLCMTGCPYSLIYSASHTWDRLRSAGRVRYHGGLLATRVEEVDSHVVVTASDLTTGRSERFTGDRVLVACGAVGSTRLIVGSLGLFDAPIPVKESTQFILPFVSGKPTSDPRHQRDFTLNQFNMVVDLDGGHDISQLHFYTYNDAFVDNLPGALRGRWAEGPRRFALKRLSLALGYLPSWASPTFSLVGRPASAPHGLAEVRLEAAEHHFASNAFLRQVLRRVTASAPSLDLWPVLPSLSISKPGKSYHWGSMFPHASSSRDGLSSDLTGRVGSLRRVHMVDAAVLPTVPATTFTLTVMANAHRIASTLLTEAS